jgi:hypothetical protein
MFSRGRWRGGWEESSEFWVLGSRFNASRPILKKPYMQRKAQNTEHRT